MKKLYKFLLNTLPRPLLIRLSYIFKLFAPLAYYGSKVYLSGRGEAIPLKENYCEIDPDTNDKYGVPVLKFRYKWSDYEYKQAKHMHDTF